MVSSSWENPDTIRNILGNAIRRKELNELYHVVLTRIMELETVSYDKKVKLISYAKEVVNEFYG